MVRRFPRHPRDRHRGDHAREARQGRDEAKFENTGGEDARLDATIQLVSAGETATEAMDPDIPSVPGGTTGKGLFSFVVEDTSTFDDAVLTLGQPTNQQAVLPLKGGEAVTREPVKRTVSGTGKAGDLQIDLAEP